ncbi:MAG: hypothetical protein WBP61_03820 [Nocardioides sp.]
MSTAAARPEKQSGWHPVNVGHLVMGIALLGIVAVWALIQADVVSGADVRWLLPVPWVLAGLGGLLALGLSGSRRRSAQQVGWVQPMDAESAPENESGEETR